MNNTFVGTSTYVKPSFSKSSISKGRSASSLSEETLRQTLNAMSSESSRKTGTGNIMTATQAQIMSTLRTTSSTNYFNSNNIISTSNTLEHSQYISNGLKINSSSEFSKAELRTLDKYAQRDNFSYEALTEKNGSGKISFNYTSDNRANFVEMRGNLRVDAKINSAMNQVSATASSIRGGATSAFAQASRLSGNEDLATASAGGVGTAGVATIQAFESAQKVTEKGIAAGIAVGKGAIATGDFATKGIKTGVDFAQTMAVGRNVTILDGKAIDILKLHAVENSLNQTKIAEGILKGAHQLQTGVNKVNHLVETGVKTGKYVGDVATRGIQITRNVFAGRNVAYQLQAAQRLAAEVGNKLATATSIGLKTGAVVGLKTAHNMKLTFVKALPKTGRILTKGGVGGWRFAAKFLRGTGDLGLQAVGTAMETSYVAAKTTKAAVKTSVKTAQTTVKAGKTIVHAGKGAFRAGKGTIKAFKFIKSNGLKNAWREARKYGAKGIKAIAKNLGKGLMEALKRLGVKLVVPITIVIIVVTLLNALSAPAMAVGSTFSGIFSSGDTGEAIDIDEYLNDATKGINPRTTALKNDIVDKLTTAASSYNIVRFKADTSESEGGIVTEHTYEAVSSVLPTDEEIKEMVKPLFNAVILMNYDNAPTDAQCQDLLDHIIEKMFVVTSEETSEQCGQDITTGAGTVDTCSSCGAVHAHGDCPNPTAVSRHSSYTCSQCDSLTCPGHTSSNYPAGGSSTTYCSGCQNSCSGHSECAGHSVMTYKVSCEGIYSLVQEYFQDPIDTLENTDPRTEEEEKKLGNLKSYYAIFEQMAQMASIGGYSGGMTVEDLSNVQWVNGSRVGCDGIIEYAKQYLGNIGGQPFWSDYGFSKRVAWCACYVYYVMRHSGYGATYPTSTNYAYCQTMADTFSAAGRFANRDFEDIVAGDVIYFDWGGDGHTDHTGLVIGRDATKVYTIEGNSGDQVKIKSYNIGSSVIYGYGLMNY